MGAEINPGSVVVQLYDTNGAPIPKIQVLLACVNLLNPDQTMQADDKITREGGNVSWAWYPVDTEYELRINTYEPQPQYTNIVVRIPNAQIAQLHTFTLASSGQVPVPPGPITGYGTCSEWKNVVFGVFAKHDFQTVGPDNEGGGPTQAPFLRATIDEIQAAYNGPNKHYVQWQHESVGVPLELRPRLFLPHAGTDPFKKYADIGDWMTPIKWEHCSE